MKNSFIKVMAICFLIVIVLSWIVPVGGVATDGFVSLETVLPLGIFDLPKIIFSLFGSFISYGLLFLVIGAFYGVLNKTCVYSSVVEDIVKSVSKNKMILTLVTIIFIILSSILGLPALLFVFIPFVATILLKSGYSKMQVFTATVGAILVGQIGSTLGINTWTYFSYYFQVDFFTEIVIRGIILVVISVLYILLVTKKQVKKSHDKIEIPLYEEMKCKKSKIPFIVVTSVMSFLLILGLYSWTATFGIEIFNDFYELITQVTINDFAIIQNIIGSVSALGNWSNYDLMIILLITSVVLSWIYNVKIKVVLDGMIKGMKEVLPVAIFAVVASLLFHTFIYLGYQEQPTSFVNTILNEIMGSSNPGIISIVFGTIISSFFFNDTETMLNVVGSFMMSAENLSVNMVIIQVVNGLVMLIAPVSIFLVAGLTMFKISYTEWFKYIVKYVLIILAFITAIGLILLVI